VIEWCRWHLDFSVTHTSTGKLKSSYFGAVVKSWLYREKVLIVVPLYTTAFTSAVRHSWTRGPWIMAHIYSHLLKDPGTLDNSVPCVLHIFCISWEYEAELGVADLLLLVLVGGPAPGGPTILKSLSYFWVVSQIFLIRTEYSGKQICDMLALFKKDSDVSVSSLYPAILELRLAKVLELVLWLAKVFTKQIWLVVHIIGQLWVVVDDICFG